MGSQRVTQDQMTYTFIFNDADFEISPHWLSSPWEYPLLSPPGRNGYHGPWRGMGGAWVADQGSTCIGLVLSNGFDGGGEDVSVTSASGLPAVCPWTVTTKRVWTARAFSVLFGEAEAGRPHLGGWTASLWRCWIQNWSQWTGQNSQFSPPPDVWERARLFEPSWGFYKRLR